MVKQDSFYLKLRQNVAICLQKIIKKQQAFENYLIDAEYILMEQTMGNISRKSFLKKATSREDYRQFLKDEFAHVLPSDVPPTTSNIVEYMQDAQVQAINRFFNRLKRERFKQFEKSMIE